MVARTEEADAASRPPLHRRRVLQAAVDLADRDGLGALTMRRLASELGVEAMSLYHHVAGKDAVLEGIVEVVVDEINQTVADLPAGADGWRAAMRDRILRARTVMLRHPWAPRLLETHTATSPAVLGYFDGLVGVLRAGGFSSDLAHHAMHALGSRALGFTQELFEPDDADAADVQTPALLEQMADAYPNLVAMLTEVAHDHPDSTLGWCDDQAEFEFGLDLLLDGLEQRRVHS